jgi:hypothetical protein
MKRLLLLSVFWLGISTGLLAAPQQDTGEIPSLGQLARKYRAERSKEGVKPVKVFTNDNLSAPPSGEASTAEAATPAKPGDKTPSRPAPAPTTPPGDSKMRGEKHYREAMKELQEKLAIHQRELAVLNQKLAQGDMQYYPDPNKSLLEQYSRADVNKLRQDITKKNQEIAADEKAIEDLRDQLRRDGGDPGWLR